LNVHERLQEIFYAIFGDDIPELRPDMTAEDIEGWDSVAHINLMFAIEEEFEVHFSESQLADFAIVGELEAFLAAQGRR
jgi:acyl carrier protein